MDGLAGLEIKEASILQEDCAERIWLDIATISGWFGDGSRRVGALESVVRHNPASRPALRGLGEVALRAKQYQRAIPYIQKLIFLDFGDSDAKTMLLKCFIEANMPERVYEFLECGAVTDGDLRSQAFLFTLGVFYERCGDYAMAESSYYNVLCLGSSFEKIGETYVRMGSLYARRGETKTALKLFGAGEALSTRKEVKEKIRVEMSQALILGARLKEAWKKLEKISSTGLAARVERMRGWICALKGRASEDPALFEEAQEHFDRSECLSPFSPLTAHYRGMAFLYAGKEKESYLSLKAAVEIDSNNPGLWDGISKLYFRRGKYSDAIFSYSNAIKKWEHDSVLWYNIGVVYEVCGQAEDATGSYQNADSLEPGRTPASERLRGLEEGGSSDPEQLDLDPAIFSRKPTNYFSSFV
ncbi:MAG: TPR-containing protein [Amphiamblys sp. WSBS2006]|nr:MAG: TPR-containing protein [Amphiamblys sp. WSBS2006]